MSVQRVFLPLVLAPIPTPSATLTPTPTATPSPIPFVNGDFEQGWTGWTPDPASRLASSISSNYYVSPTHSLLLGDPSYPCDSVPIGFAQVTRQVTVPSISGLAISFQYRVFTQDAKKNRYGEDVDTFEVWIDGSRLLQDGADQATKCAGAQDLGWRSFQASLDANRGQTITLRLAIQSREPRLPPSATTGWYNTWAYVDDVRIELAQ